MHIILKPTKAELTHDTDKGGNMQCYIKIKQDEKIRIKGNDQSCYDG